MLEAVEGGLCLLEVLEAPPVMRCVLLCILEAVEGGLCLPEVPEVMRCALLFAGGDALYAALYGVERGG